ncbi:MAG TPA: permease-like cell division protein FtsX [Marmoricola sp.]|nr:permease-like cell division protein FtsX [Marmoricola sp.]
MQLRYVFSETRTGLKRNVSMTIALIVTIFVSLTLVGVGILLQKQADKAENYWGTKLQITVFLCTDNSRSEQCANGATDPAQKAAIEDILTNHPEVASYRFQTKQEAYDVWRKVYSGKDKAEQEIYSTVTVDDMPESYWVTLKDPQKYRGVEDAVAGMDGVNNVQDLRAVLKPIYNFINAMKLGALGVAVFLLVAAVLQVANTIRLAAFARRREISIMRLVGAGTLYIQLPFLMETLVAALIGVGLAALAIGALMFFFVYGNYFGLPGGLRDSPIVEWIDWWDAAYAVGAIAVLGVLLTVIPTLVMTRKYLKV